MKVEKKNCCDLKCKQHFKVVRGHQSAKKQKNNSNHKASLTTKPEKKDNVGKSLLSYFNFKWRQTERVYDCP